jgi:hypothetical protein
MKTSIKPERPRRAASRVAQLLAAALLLTGAAANAHDKGDRGKHCPDGREITC